MAVGRDTKILAEWWHGTLRKERNCRRQLSELFAEGLPEPEVREKVNGVLANRSDDLRGFFFLANNAGNYSQRKEYRDYLKESQAMLSRFVEWKIGYRPKGLKSIDTLAADAIPDLRHKNVAAHESGIWGELPLSLLTVETTHTAGRVSKLRQNLSGQSSPPISIA